MGAVLDSASFYKRVGELVRRARKKRSLSQSALASAIGLTRSSISNFEQGRQQLMLHTLVDIAEVLGIELTALLPLRTAAEAKVPESEMQKYTRPERAFIEAGIRRPVRHSKEPE